jgi:hypothetical protein
MKETKPRIKKDVTKVIRDLKATLRKADTIKEVADKIGIPYFSLIRINTTGRASIGNWIKIEAYLNRIKQ